MGPADRLRAMEAFFIALMAAVVLAASAVAVLVLFKLVKATNR